MTDPMLKNTKIMKHTKGVFSIGTPERLDPVSCQSKVYVWTNEEDPRELHAKVFGYTIEEAEANAKLIAAAPDLLQTLIKLEIEIETAEMCFDRKNAVLEDIKQAIKKATE